ncbi:hypothetical protein GJ744_004671 [Endocarpon pusillum]|uniref:Uncharacterized protein n=1 Tax=Endocarpon pusillum TaxID=364733 RepID=A0A8H7E6U6_9EURO|nr:hypothetical protein GJ744_004671 [Endocarpon pusillum]
MAEWEHGARLHRDAPTPYALGPEVAVQQVAMRHINPNTTPPTESQEQHDYEFRDQQEDLLERLSNHYAPYEGYDLLIKTFEKTINGSVKATFQDGTRLAEIREEAVRPKVGLTFLPGADTPQVNQMEEIQMTQITPDQKDASWRVNTAGALLKNFSVRQDMTMSFSDNTAAVINAMRRRQSGADGPRVEPNMSSKALAIRRAADRFVTIDSANVKIVNDLNLESWDLEGLLVEVDQSSLMSLISNYQRVIRRGGPDLPTTETIQLLDVMIEDARRLCVRSPILFRMSTRRQIVSSKNTRYGVDDGSMFKTLTTSAGIKNIISLSSSYFNSLSQPATPVQQEKMQQEIRPRFLQMLVLLLALLNNDDLALLEEFLEETYGIKANRQHLELLILKVLPLSSINSKIFLNALVSAVDLPEVKPSPNRSDQPIVWNVLITSLLQQGYILPGTIDQLGGFDQSWIIKWPKDGFKDAGVFKNLQYSGDSRTVNEIPPMNLNPDPVSSEVTVVLANGGSYIISHVDLENIMRMTPGKYSVTEAREGGRSFDLDISDVCVNQSLFRATGEINAILGLVKSILPVRPKNEIVRRFDLLLRSGSLRTNGRKYEDSSLPELKCCGRLNYNVARLNGHYLALACKVDGRKITKRELLRHLHSDMNKMEATIRGIEAIMQTAFEGKHTSDHVRQTTSRLKESVAQIGRMSEDVERKKSGMSVYDSALQNEPVSKVLYQVGTNETQVSVWSDYKAWHQASENVLYIESHRRIVQQVAWQGDTLEVFFEGLRMRYYAAPLRPLEEHEKWEELHKNDVVLLCGHYMLVVEMTGETYFPSMNADGLDPRHRPRQEQDQSRPVSLGIVINWLKVTGIEAVPGTRRHQNRERVGPILRTAIR